MKNIFGIWELLTGFFAGRKLKRKALELAYYCKDACVQDKFNLSQKYAGRFRAFIGNTSENYKGILLEGKKEVVIAFCGTKKIPDYFGNVRLSLTGWPNNEGSGSKVHTGFLKAYESVSEEIQSFISKISESKKEVYVTGHSRGGAIATLCAFDIKTANPGLKVFMCSFGSPMAGNKKFAKDYGKVMGKKSLRVYINGDPVTLPQANALGLIGLVPRKIRGAAERASEHFLGDYEHVPNAWKIDYVGPSSKLPALDRWSRHSMKSYTNSLHKFFK
jgi:hypothetical protein